VQEGEREAIETLLRLGARPDLQAAAGLGDLAALESALLKGAQSDAKLKALHGAATNGQTAAVAMLLDLGQVDVNASIGLGTTALHVAALNGHARLVEQLLERGAEPTLRDAQYNGTAGDWAAHGGHSDLAKSLRDAALPRE
jgi:ankyrin repeat protein